MKIAISEIKINAGRRETSLSGIDELARSISEVGLLNPITTYTHCRSAPIGSGKAFVLDRD